MGRVYDGYYSVVRDAVGNKREVHGYILSGKDIAEVGAKAQRLIEGKGAEVVRW